MAAIEEEYHREEDAEATKTRSKRKFKVFCDSGQSDNERRALRYHLRNVRQQMEQPIIQSEQDIENIPNGGQAIDSRERVISKARDDNNTLFEKVAYTREAVLDADNVELIATKFVQNAERLIQVPTYDPLQLVKKLRKKCTIKSSSSGERIFDWKTLGRETGVCFNALPSGVSFLAGVIEGEADPSTMKQRKRRAPRVKPVEEDAEEQRPELIQNKPVADANQLSATEKSMKYMGKKLIQMSQTSHKDTGTTELDGLHFLFNPKSFTQTVENIFHFSFLVKKGQAGIALNEHGELKVRPVVPTQDGPPTTQSVCALTMRDWKLLCKNWNVEGALPHRSGGGNLSSR